MKPKMKLTIFVPVVGRIDSSTREFMESTRFGFDFSNVSIHKGEIVIGSASSIKMLFRVIRLEMILGFAEGQYMPNSFEGESDYHM